MMPTIEGNYLSSGQFEELTSDEITTNPDEDQRVVSEVRAGYRFKDRIIRPARVKVAKYVAPAHA